MRLHRPMSVKPSRSRSRNVPLEVWTGDLWPVEASADVRWPVGCRKPRLPEMRRSTTTREQGTTPARDIRAVTDHGPETQTDQPPRYSHDRFVQRLIGLRFASPTVPLTQNPDQHLPIVQICTGIRQVSALVSPCWYRHNWSVAFAKPGFLQRCRAKQLNSQTEDTCVTNVRDQTLILRRFGPDPVAIRALRRLSPLATLWQEVPALALQWLDWRKVT